jgi:hypothetical protein
MALIRFIFLILGAVMKGGRRIPPFRERRLSA